MGLLGFTLIKLQLPLVYMRVGTWWAVKLGCSICYFACEVGLEIKLIR